MRKKTYNEYINKEANFCFSYYCLLIMYTKFYLFIYLFFDRYSFVFVFKVIPFDYVLY